MSVALTNETPVEPYVVKGVPVYVKREDLCCPYPGPMFSKMRGVAAHIQSRPEPVIGALDTFHSKAGWGVAWACWKLGKRAVVYWPRFKADPPTGLPRRQQQEAVALGATAVALDAGRSAILYHRAKKDLGGVWGGADQSYMMPNALKLSETIEETAAEVGRTRFPEGFGAGDYPGTIVISVSSGTIAAGVLRGLGDNGLAPNVVLHLGYSRSRARVMNYITSKGGLLFPKWPSLSIIDEGFGYKDAVEFPSPFPCNEYYDLKAWRWLARNVWLVPLRL